MSQLSAENIYVSFSEKGQHKTVLNNVSLQIKKGASVVLLGPSGCGKSTLLNVLAGFQKPQSGQIKIDHQVLTNPSGQRAVVFQDHALMPWLNTIQNVEVGLLIQGVKADERKAKALHFLALVGLKDQAEQSIQALSGGQKQRVGLARALAVEPDFILLDEPFGALDALTREKMQSLLLNIWKETGVGLLLITHSVDEALLLGTELYVLKGPPAELGHCVFPPFAQRFLEGETVRDLKAEHQFSQLRQQLLDQLLGED